MLPSILSTRYFFFLLLALPGYLFGQAQPATTPSSSPERLQKAQEAEQRARTENDSTQLAEAYYLYGKAYAIAGDFPTSQRYFLQSLRILEPRGDSFEVGRLYLRLAENESRRGNKPKAWQHALHAEQVLLHIGSEEGLHKAYGVLGQLSELTSDSTGQPDYNRSLTYYRKTERLAYKLKDTLGMADVWLKLGNLLSFQRSTEAIPYLMKALAVFRTKQKETSYAYTLIALSTADIQQKQFGRAWQALQETEQLMPRFPAEYDMAQALDQAFLGYYVETMQWQEAYERMIRLQTRKDIIGAIQRDNLISRLNTEFETQKKEAALETRTRELELSTQNQHLQRWFIITLFLLFALTLVISFIYFRLNRKNQRISQVNAQLVKEQSHRIKNHLQMVASLLNMQSRRLSDGSAKKAVTESQLRVQSIALLQRQLYDGQGVSEVDLDAFVTELATSVLRSCGYSYCQTSFHLEQVRLGADQAISLGLILTELITNACKYAFPNHDCPELRISCQVKNNRLHVTVVDNGPGLAKPIRLSALEPASGGSFGMQLIKMQAEQLLATFGFAGEEANGADKNMVNTTTTARSTGLIFHLDFPMSTP